MKIQKCNIEMLGFQILEEIEEQMIKIKFWDLNSNLMKKDRYMINIWQILLNLDRKLTHVEKMLMPQILNYLFFTFLNQIRKIETSLHYTTCGEVKHSFPLFLFSIATKQRKLNFPPLFLSKPFLYMFSIQPNCRRKR